MNSFRIILRKTTYLLLCAFVLFCSFLPVKAAENYPADIRSEIKDDYTGKTVILHSNDVHGAIDGYAVIAGLREEFEDRGAEVIVVDAGDYFQGDPYVNQSLGSDAVTMMNAVGYQISTLGNHEFDYGYTQIKENLKNAKFEVVCANILENGKEVFEPWTIYETSSCKRIGFLGLATPETQTKSRPSNTQGLTMLAGKEMADCAQEHIHSLQEQKTDLIIGLCHLGVAAESVREGNSSLDLYRQIQGMDMVIDGHSHTIMTEGNNHEPIQSTGTKFAYVGVIVIDEQGIIEDHYLIPTDNLRKDEYVMSVAQDIKARINAEYNVKFAYSEVELEGSGLINRTQESNNGNLITDAFLWYAQNHVEMLPGPIEDVIGFINGGALRGNIPQGDITKKDINTVQPFANTVNFITVTGQQLLEILEAATFCTPDKIGAFPQTSGMKFTLDTTKEYDAGELYPNSTYHKPLSIQRISVDSIHGIPFDVNKNYILASTNFLAEGGDTYTILAQCDHIETGDYTDEVIMNYITKELGGVITQEKYGHIRGDMTIITEDTSASVPDTYIVKPGDCLWNIAVKVYNNGYLWKQIYQANTDKIVNPSLIYPGQELRIPA
ncbi:MAG: 5'-nucleotidase C-terminal domain-containing protein [Solobacterium sp.]|nr:5'-nucleotidase C-terminal domain-containing protein [Solobacterium sp.]